MRAPAACDVGLPLCPDRDSQAALELADPEWNCPQAADRDRLLLADTRHPAADVCDLAFLEFDRHKAASFDF